MQDDRVLKWITGNAKIDLTWLAPEAEWRLILYTAPDEKSLQSIDICFDSNWQQLESC